MIRACRVAHSNSFITTYNRAVIKKNVTRAQLSFFGDHWGWFTVKLGEPL